MTARSCIDAALRPQGLIYVLSLCFFLASPSLGQEMVKGAHENLPKGALKDDLGITVPVAVDYPARRYPAEHDFPTGPDIGERLPDFELPNQDGQRVDFHRDRGDQKAIVVFYRSAVW